MAMFEKTKYKRVGCSVHLFFILAIPLWANNTGFAQSGIGYRIPDRLSAAYSDVISLNIQQAREQLRAFRDKGDAHPFQLYIESMGEVIQLLTTGERSDYLRNRSLEDKYLDMARKLDDNDPYKAFLVSEIRTQWAVVKLKFGDEFAALWNLRQVYFISKKALKQYPGFLPLYKTHGFLQALFSGTPKKYQWIVKLFGINPDMESALALLDKANVKENPLYPESGMLTALIQAYYYSDFESAIPLCNQLLMIYPESALIRLVYAFILVKDSNDAAARHVLSGWSKSVPGQLQIPSRHYLLGEINLHAGRYDAAVAEFERFIRLQNGDDLIKDAHYKIAMCHLLSDREQLARDELETASRSGESKTELDSYADRMIRTGTLPDPQLLKVRYFTDGGYFHKADSVLKLIDPGAFTNPSEVTEYYYRKARLLHKSGRIGKAITSYKKTIELQGKAPLYFAPHSCLQLGYILTDDSPETACIYFKKVFGYKFEIYYHSIRQKAKLALKKNGGKCG